MKRIYVLFWFSFRYPSVFFHQASKSLTVFRQLLQFFNGSVVKHLLSQRFESQPKKTLHLFSVYSGEVSAHLSLAQYVRDYLGLTGTKITCAQAGQSELSSHRKYLMRLVVVVYLLRRFIKSLNCYSTIELVHVIFCF